METPFSVIAMKLLLVIFLVLLNGFFVAAEFALVKVRQSRLTQLVNEGNRRAKFAKKVADRLDSYLSATQLGITLASLGLGWVGEPAISELIVQPLLSQLALSSTTVHTISVIIGFMIITFLHIIVGELAPKSLAIQKAESTSLWIAGPLMYFYKIMMPIIWLLNQAANLLLRWIGVQPVNEAEFAHTEDEIRILMNQSHKSGYINKTELSLFEHIFEFSDRLAREVMVPRIAMDCFFTNLPLEQNLKLVSETMHTRFPVAKTDKDYIIGIIHVTDLYLIALQQEAKDWKKIIRPVLTVPESMEISQVLRMMQKKRSHMAIVIDEFGGTAGLLTIEDILEEIVGEIQDEFDNRPPDIEVSGDVTSMDGRTLIDEVNDLFNLSIDDEEVDTIGGWVFTHFETPPKPGQSIDWQGYRFEVTEMDHYRITRLKVTRIETGTDLSEDTARRKHTEI